MSFKLLLTNTHGYIHTLATGSGVSGWLETCYLWSMIFNCLDRVSPFSSQSQGLGLGIATKSGNFKLLSSCFHFQSCWDYTCAWPQLLFKVYFLCINVCLHVNVWVPHICLVLMEVGGIRSPGSGVTDRPLWAAMWRAETEMCTAEQSWLNSDC